MDNQLALTYGTQRPRWYARRRTWWIVVVLVVVAAIVHNPAVRYGRRCVIQYQTLKTQREWASPAVAQGTLVYTDDPAYAKALTARAGYTHYLFANTDTASHTLYGGVYCEGGGWVRLGTHFRGPRVTPSGTRLLTGIEFYIRQEMESGRRFATIHSDTLTAAGWRPGSFGTSVSEEKFAVPLQAQDRFTVRVGRADPDMPSRFTIPYTLNDEPGEVEGVVLDDGRIRLKVLSGPATLVPR